MKSTLEAHASKGAVIAGVVIGAAVGMGTLGSAAECRIDQSITGCRLQMFAPLWMPNAGGSLGYAVTRHTDEHIFYRRD